MPMADPVYPNRAQTDPLQPTVLSDPDRALPERATPSQLGHIPEPTRPSNPRLNSAAETVGTALGSAVVQIRRAPDRVQGGLQEAKQRFRVIRGRKGQEAKESLNDAVEKARQTGEDLKDTAQEKLTEARTRAQHLAHNYPLQTIATAAGIGFLLGIVLRLWRDHAD
jgi:vacuolar-type H+-ATPase subunit H